MRDLSVETTRHGQAVTLVDQVCLELRTGEALALVGASGSGKSLTCSASLGLTPPGVRCVAGELELNGARQRAENLRGRQVSVIMQNPRSAFNPVRTMRQHAMESFVVQGVPSAERQTRIEAAMLDAGLPEPRQVLKLHAFEMSGGMLQRMMIALALASEAPFLFADEPTTDLDLIVQREILDLLDELKHKRGLGLLLVTHDMGVVARLADRVAVIEAGRIVEQGPVEEMFRCPNHDVTRSLVSAHLSLYSQRSTA
ncbi:MAG: ATP-binding cassette domain-containing protein [Xanthobacter sp.]